MSDTATTTCFVSGKTEASRMTASSCPAAASRTAPPRLTTESAPPDHDDPWRAGRFPRAEQLTRKSETRDKRAVMRMVSSLDISPAVVPWATEGGLSLAARLDEGRSAEGAGGAPGLAWRRPVFVPPACRCVSHPTALPCGLREYPSTFGRSTLVRGTAVPPAGRALRSEGWWSERVDAQAMD